MSRGKPLKPSREAMEYDGGENGYTTNIHHVQRGGGGGVGANGPAGSEEEDDMK